MAAEGSTHDYAKSNSFLEDPALLEALLDACDWTSIRVIDTHDRRKQDDIARETLIERLQRRVHASLPHFVGDDTGSIPALVEAINASAVIAETTTGRGHAADSMIPSGLGISQGVSDRSLHSRGVRHAYTNRRWITTGGSC